MLRRKEDEIPEREISLWLEKNGIPYQRYGNLSVHGKVVLRNLIGIPTRPTTYSERRDIYKKLCLPDTAGRDSIDPVDFVPDEELEKLFTPVPPSETLSDWEKY